MVLTLRGRKEEEKTEISRVASPLVPLRRICKQWLKDRVHAAGSTSELLLQHPDFAPRASG